MRTSSLDALRSRIARGLARATRWLGPTSLAALGLVAATTFAASSACAQRDLAQEHFRRGESAYQAGNYALAVGEWQAAYTADPRPRIQYNIYQAYERLGRLTEAAESLQLYLQSADPDDPSYGDANSRMSALQQRLQATGIRVVGGIEGAQITVDEQDWGRIPRPDRIRVNPGNHRVVITLPGFQPFVSSVVVPAGQVVDVVAELVAGGDTATGTPATSTGAAASDDRTNTTPIYIASGVLAAGAVGSGLWLLNRASELSDCDRSEFFCPNEKTVVTQGNIALGLTIVLAAGAVGTLVWAIVAGSDSNETATSGCTPGLTGATCRVSF